MSNFRKKWRNTSSFNSAEDSLERTKAFNLLSFVEFLQDNLSKFREYVLDVQWDAETIPPDFFMSDKQEYASFEPIEVKLIPQPCGDLEPIAYSVIYDAEEPNYLSNAVLNGINHMCNTLMEAMFSDSIPDMFIDPICGMDFAVVEIGSPGSAYTWTYEGYLIAKGKSVEDYGDIEALIYKENHDQRLS